MKLNCRGSVINFLENLARNAPKGLAPDEPQFDSAMLIVRLGKDLAFDLISALNSVRLELVPRHADDIELVHAFWEDLVCKVDAHAQEYLKAPQALADLVDTFGGKWKKPLSKIEIVYSIENLSVGKEPIVVFGVEFFDPTDESLAEKDLTKEIARWLDREDNPFTLAAVKVEAAPSADLFQAGKSQVVNALTAMRAAAMCGRAAQSLLDELFQWKLSGFCIARSISPGDPGFSQEAFHRQFDPLVMELSSPIREGMKELKLDYLEDLPLDIRNRVLRSLYWLAHSVNHEADDHKVVDLCTALEVLLIPEERGVSSKGTTIALRYHLLMGNLIDTSVKWLYDRRNEIVHGGPLPVVGPREVWELRLICYQTIRSVIYFSKREPAAKTHLDLVNTLETEDRLNHFTNISKYAEKDNRQLPEIVKAAKKKLNQLGSKN